VLPLDHREQRDGGADAGQGVDQVEEAAPQHAGVGTGADDVVGVVQHRGEEEHRRERGSEGDQVEGARDQRGFPRRAHRSSAWCCGGHVSLLVSDREQREADIAERAEQSVERRLVDDGTFDEGGAVGQGGEGHPVESGRPAGAEVPLEADLVPAGAHLLLRAWRTSGTTAR
jgi:hypothetical protein